MGTVVRKLWGAALVLGLVLAAAACGGGGRQGEPRDNRTPTIALLLPETKTTRYESHDRPNFEQRVRALCSECQILYSNAGQDASKQQSQAEAALTNGADVLVLDPVDSRSAAAIVATADQASIPVISYDRLILDADVDYHVSFDAVRVGELQAQALVDRLEATGQGNGTIVMINGAPSDNNAKLVKQGAHSVIDASNLRVGQEFDTPDWSPDQAQKEMEQALTKLGADTIAGVYAANDGMAGGAIAAMKGAGVDPLPPVTGQDAELAAIQRILAGEQYMTIYKAIKLEAGAAATLAVALARGEEPPAGLVSQTVNNGRKDVPTAQLDLVAVTKDNADETVIADGFWAVEEICTPDFANACTQVGLR
jgi:D-xylose transport system substrate-binding protein